MSDDRIVRLPIRGRGPPGGGPPDELSARVARVEVRVDEIARRLDGIDGRLAQLGEALGRLPSKEFVATTVIAVSGISLAAALAFAALTFNIADYAAKTAQQAEQIKAPAGPAAPAQPIVVVLPSPAASPPQPGPPPQQGVPPQKPPAQP